MKMRGNALAASEEQRLDALAPFVLRSLRLDWTRPYVMGIVNVTPDSFSDGGNYNTVDAALDHAEQLIEAGADLLDIGGESTRPNATAIGAQEECDRVLPVIEKLAARFDTPISVDTTKAIVAKCAVSAGAEIVNDVSGGSFDSTMFAAVEEVGAFYVCGHVRGASLAEIHNTAPATVSEIGEELQARLTLMPAALRQCSMVDPCIGFGKSLNTNVALLAEAMALSTRLTAPILIGASRKRFLGEITGAQVGDRDGATVGANLAAVASGAHMLRVHNVSLLTSALAVFQRVCGEALLR